MRRFDTPLTAGVKKRNGSIMPEAFPIYDKLGGKAAVREIVSRRRQSDKALSLSTMRMWKRKGRIPGNICQLLQAECQERSIWFSVPSDFEVIPGDSFRNVVVENQKEGTNLDAKKAV